MQLQPASTPQESQRRTLRYHLAPGLELGPQQFKRIYTDKRHGVPFVSSRDMFFLPLRPERFLSRRMLKLGDLMVPDGWLLLSRSGTAGNVPYVNRHLAECAISDHAIRIEPASRLLPRASTALRWKLEPKHIASIPVAP